jgi:hypothetical protein
VSLPNLDSPVVIFSLAFGPLGVIVILWFLRDHWKRRR